MAFHTKLHLHRKECGYCYLEFIILPLWGTDQPPYALLRLDRSDVTFDANWQQQGEIFVGNLFKKLLICGCI